MSLWKRGFRKGKKIVLRAIAALLSPLLTSSFPSQRVMPPLSPALETLRDFYKFYFLPDGYPGRYKDGDLFVHPIYGAYILEDYIGQYNQSPTDELKDAIVTVANASITRMEKYNGALVFWYPAGKVYRKAEKHYSGLTQSRYLPNFYQTYQITGDTCYRDASERVFKSLLIPDEDGGVYHSWSGGVSLEEISTKPNAFVLNGWLTALVHLHDYARMSGSLEAAKLFEESVQAVARILPLFDAPVYFNSRYGLTGFQHLKLGFSSSTTGITVTDLMLEIPTEGMFEIPPYKETSRWNNYIFEQDAKIVTEGMSLIGRKLRMNLVLSRLSFPKENVLHMTLCSPRELQMDVSLEVGIYDCLSGIAVHGEWKRIMSLLVTEEVNQFTIPIPWESADLSAYPTNFAKKINGKHYNIYHYIHIDRLRYLYEITGYDIFRAYADKWDGYTHEWPEMKIYKDVEHGRLPKR
jgi:hypothetical protein